MSWKKRGLIDKDSYKTYYPKIYEYLLSNAIKYGYYSNGDDNNVMCFTQAPEPVPIDTGYILYQGKRYDIYVPNFNDNGSNADFKDNDWMEIDQVNLINRDFDWATFISSITLEGDNDNQQFKNNINNQRANLVASALNVVNTALDATKITNINMVFQQNNGVKRVVIQYASSDYYLHSHAGEEITLSELKGGNSYYWQNEIKKELSKSIGEEKPIYDIKYTIDKAHEKDPYVGYLSYNSSGEFVFTPKLYELDRGVIGHKEGVFIFKNWKTDYYIRDLIEDSTTLDSIHEKALYHAIYDEHNDVGIFSN